MRKITLLLIAVLIAGIILTSAVYAQIMRKPGDWSFHRKLTDDGGAIDPAIAVEGNNIHVLYIDTSSNAETFGGSYYQEICYKGSSDNGSTWNSAVGVSGVRLIDTSFRSKPVIAVSNKSIHTAWVERSHVIRYKNSFDNGRNWNTDTILHTGYIESLGIEVDGDIVGVTWVESDLSWRVHYRLSKDGGRTWDEEESLSYTAANFNVFSIDGTSVYIPYISQQPPEERQLMLHKSIDAGKSWSDISIPVDYNYSVIARGIVVNGSDVHLLLSCGYLKSIDGGENWSALNESISGSRLILSKNNLYVSRFDWRSDSMNYTKSNDYGLSWSSYTTIFNRTSQYDFDFTLSENDVHLVFYERKSDSFDYFDYEIYYMKSTDEGKSWMEEIQITDHTNEYRQYMLGIGIFAIIASSILLLYFRYKQQKQEHKDRHQRYIKEKKKLEEK
jgi:hypothetical protein